ncbi:hypothetical protein K443DRAFT_9711 [Laccaria amethystina LaAM-08-1]|uniref:Uncharacterized protein n=1 Tax=Laccaria amethystina LaAM-08-1 TaxID=1095629 RepID=A0A0C9WM05_9AGAR|nr:hypothetical protein K443DRAFT_9711 [Laccaria amethystina LaAM-08-1]
MALKIQLDITAYDVELVSHQQLKLALVPFPNFQPDDDVPDPMSDAKLYKSPAPPLQRKLNVFRCI